MRCVDPPLVLLHGFTQTRQSWRRTARALAGRYRAIDPGSPRPRSGGAPDASFDACAAYVRALGAVHARGLLDGRPDRALHGADDARHRAAGARRREPGHRRSGRSAPSAAPPTTRWRTGSRRWTIEAFAREWGSQPLFAGQPERVAAAAYADRLRNTPAGLAAALRGLGTGVMEPLWERLGELTIPVTLDHRRARREVPRARRDDARATTGRAARRRARGRTRAELRRSHAVDREAIFANCERGRRREFAYQSGSPSSSASA